VRKFHTALALFWVACASTAKAPQAEAVHTCFLLYDLDHGELVREGDACTTRVTPASTFKIPHALAALDSGVLASPSVTFSPPADLEQDVPETWKRDHSLQTAIRYLVVWYFQRVALLLGLERERDYLARFHYGNQDVSSGGTTFWLEESLKISPDEQETFLVNLYRDRLPMSVPAMRTVRELLIQPKGVVVNAMGEHPFDAPWPEDAVVSTKTGMSMHVRWLVGHVRRGERALVFVSCVTGQSPPLSAIDLAAASLKRAAIL